MILKINDALARGFLMNVAPELFRSRVYSDVIHGGTCPCCGKKLVNIYRYKDEYLCRICKLSAEHVDNTLNKNFEV